MIRDDAWPDASALDAIAAALESVPRAAYSVPHDYPNAIAAYTAAPMAERERPASDRLRLYAHIPFCRYHCTFCYFAVRVGTSVALMQRYVRAVVKELEWIAPGTPLSQLYVGGGTPTALPPDLLDEVLVAMPAAPHLMAPPSTPWRPPRRPSRRSTSRSSSATASGRVSMGVQSLDPDVLGKVRREQTLEQALAACDLLVGSGLIVNVDLIYGLPGQSEEVFWTTVGGGRPWRPCADPLQPSAERADVGRSHAGRPRASRSRPAHAVAGIRETLRRGARLYPDPLAHVQAPAVGGPEARVAADVRRLHVRVPARRRHECPLPARLTVYRNHDRLEAYMNRIEAGQSPVEQVFPMTVPDRKTQFVARSLGDGKPLERGRYEKRSAGRLTRTSARSSIDSSAAGSSSTRASDSASARGGSCSMTWWRSPSIRNTRGGGSTRARRGLRPTRPATP